MDRFKNQVAVITGGADGIGFGIAERIASEGGSIALFDINEKLLLKSLKKLKDKGYTAEGYKVDISSEFDVQRAIGFVLTTLGKIDIMINAAAIVGPTHIKITEYSVEDYDKVYGVNLRGAFLMTKYALTAMEKNKYGRILLFTSIAGKEGNPSMAGYSSMKAGVIGLVKGIGKEYALSNITVNGLAPAVIKTRMNEDIASEQMAYMLAKIPMNRMGTVEEVASIATWIVSKEASFTTGFVFDISGGRATY